MSSTIRHRISLFHHFLPPIGQQPKLSLRRFPPGRVLFFASCASFACHLPPNIRNSAYPIVRQAEWPCDEANTDACNFMINFVTSPAPDMWAKTMEGQCDADRGRCKFPAVLSTAGVTSRRVTQRTRARSMDVKTWGPGRCLPRSRNISDHGLPRYFSAYVFFTDMTILHFPTFSK